MCLVSKFNFKSPSMLSGMTGYISTLYVNRVVGCLSALISRVGAPISYGKLLEKGSDKGELKRGGFVQIPPPPPCTVCCRITTSFSRLQE
jgi:hypothetical protein